MTNQKIAQAAKEYAYGEVNCTAREEYQAFIAGALKYAELLSAGVSEYEAINVIYHKTYPRYSVISDDELKGAINEDYHKNAKRYYPESALHASQLEVEKMREENTAFKKIASEYNSRVADAIVKLNVSNEEGGPFVQAAIKQLYIAIGVHESELLSSKADK
jgi:hypothetical protein